MRWRPSRFGGRLPIEHDFHETDGVLGTEIGRRKTDVNLGLANGPRHHSVDF